MNKFKVGDEVRLVYGARNIFNNLGDGNVYVVEHIKSDGVKLKGLFTYYHYSLFEIVENLFDLYVDGVLSPLEATEAMLNKDSLQVYDSNAGKWYGFHSELRDITLEDLKHIKLRHKPKTVNINGVEVVAPVELPVGTKVWYPSVACKGLQKGIAGGGLSIYWLKEEDAQKALDAMLIPFNNLNKGDK